MQCKARGRNISFLFAFCLQVLLFVLNDFINSIDLKSKLLEKDRRENRSNYALRTNFDKTKSNKK